MGVVGLAPGLFPCHVVLRGRMDALGAMVALTLRSSREGMGQGLHSLAWLHVGLPRIQIPGEDGRLFQACSVDSHFRKAPGKDGTVARAPSTPLGLVFQ